MDVYVIHCEKHKERLPNIEHHLKKLFPQLKIWDGVVISNTVTDLEKEMHKYDTKIRINSNNIFNKIGEIGCYLSHHTLLKHIKETATAKYTLILEDDGMLLKDAANLHDKLNNIDFDIFYLGLNNENKNKNIKDDIYSINKSQPVYGTHAYVVNNNKISKIYN